MSYPLSTFRWGPASHSSQPPPTLITSRTRLLQLVLVPPLASTVRLCCPSNLPSVPIAVSRYPRVSLAPCGTAPRYSGHVPPAYVPLVLASVSTTPASSHSLASR